MHLFSFPLLILDISTIFQHVQQNKKHVHMIIKSIREATVDKYFQISINLNIMKKNTIININMHNGCVIYVVLDINDLCLFNVY